MAGVFITFEGTEGSGKSTQIHLLADQLRAKSQPCLLLREPGTTPAGIEKLKRAGGDSLRHATTTATSTESHNTSVADRLRKPAMLI